MSPRSKAHAAMGDREKSVLARCCVPEDPRLVVNVRLTDLWRWTFEAVEAAPIQSDLVDRWAPDKIKEAASLRAMYGVRAVADAMMTTGLRRGEFAPRVHDGERIWRVPPEAFQSWNSDGLDLEMTWAAGRLWDFDAADGFRALAQLELPLLTTEDEAQAYKHTVTRHIAELAALPAEEPPECDPDERDALVRKLETQKRWPLREALLWVATRDLEQTAEVILTSAWAEAAEDFGLSPGVWTRSDIEGQSYFRSFVDPDPERALLQALRNAQVNAIGLQEGAGSPAEVPDYAWEHLEFAVPPGSRDGSGAMRVGQLHGVRWSGHWTGLRFDRESLWQAFPPPGQIGEPALAVESLAASDGWRVGPGERLKAWVFRSAVIEEAQRRLSGRLTKKTSMNGALWEMAQECGMTWPQDSIANAIRRGT